MKNNNLKTVYHNDKICLIIILIIKKCYNNCKKNFKNNIVLYIYFLDVKKFCCFFLKITSPEYIL